MKRVISLIILMSLLVACNTSRKISDNYGVRYVIDDNQWLTIKLVDGTDEVYFLNIVNELDYIDKGELEQLSVGTIEDDKNKSSVIYHCSSTEDGRLVEYILLNWNIEDFSFDDNQKLVDYIGLSDELIDKQLTLNELKQSENFKYKHFFTKGDYYNNISFDGDKKYDVNN